MSELMIRTSNRKLEQFFFAHAISYHHIEKSEDDLTVWCYLYDEYTAHVLEEWHEVCRRRQKIRH